MLYTYTKFWDNFEIYELIEHMYWTHKIKQHADGIK
jgi:hypothetical protein